MIVRSVFSLLSIVAIALVTMRDTAPLQATTTTSVLPDTDGDFLPDCVEWAVLTSATNPDTDGDNIGDFIEVVQRGAPRDAGAPLPADQEMRVIVTGPTVGGPASPTWFHLFVRYVEPGTPISQFQAWVELPAYPGIRFPFDVLAQGPVLFQEHNAGVDGTWLQVSVPLVQSNILHTLVPCSFNAEAIVGGRYLRSCAKLFDVGGELVTLVAFRETFYAAQHLVPQGTPTTLSNRVCLLDLEEVGSGPGGTVYEVVSAFCDDCNEVECAVTCPQSVGWLLTIPGGLAAMGGPN